MNINIQNVIGKQAENTITNRVGMITYTETIPDTEGNLTTNYLLAYNEGTKHVSLNMVNEKNVRIL